MAGTRLRRADSISNALAADRLGVSGVIFFVMSACAPLTAVAAVITTGFAVTGVTGIPIAFLVVGGAMLLFSVGFVAMARNMVNAGAFYAYISQGLGKTPGVVAAWVALLAYNAAQVSLYGGLGVVAQPLLQQLFGFAPTWWVTGLVVWALIAVLGVMRVEVNGTVLAVLLVAEVLVILLFDFTNLLHPAPGGISGETLSPGALFVPGIGALLVIANLGFVGFESTVVFSEETKNPRRTVPIATYLAVSITAVLYSFSAWAMTVATGPDKIVAVASRDHDQTLFKLAAPYVGSSVITIAQVLFVTGLFACSISFHNTTSRYIFALGRERVFPEIFGRTMARSGAPMAGSIAQSILGFFVIVIVALLGLDPLVQLFFYSSTLGGFGVLVLMTVTSVAVIAFFGRQPDPEVENIWRRLIAPAAATVVLGIIVLLGLANFETLLGVPETSALTWLLPSLYLVAAGVGLAWATYLRINNPEAYARIGLGAKAVTATGPAGPGEPPAGPGGPGGPGSPQGPGSPSGFTPAHSGPGAPSGFTPAHSGPAAASGFAPAHSGPAAPSAFGPAHAAPPVPARPDSYAGAGAGAGAPGGPGYRDVGPGYRAMDPGYRDAGQGYRDGGTTYRDSGPGYRAMDPGYQATPGYREVDPGYRPVGPGCRVLPPEERCLGHGCRYLAAEAQPSPGRPYTDTETSYPPENSYPSRESYSGPSSPYSGPGSRYLRPGSAHYDPRRPDDF